MAELCLMMARAGWFERGFEGGVRSASRVEEGHACFPVFSMDLTEVNRELRCCDFGFFFPQSCYG